MTLFNRAVDLGNDLMADYGIRLSGTGRPSWTTARPNLSQQHPRGKHIEELLARELCLDSMTMRRRFAELTWGALAPFQVGGQGPFCQDHSLDPADLMQPLAYALSRKSEHVCGDMCPPIGDAEVLLYHLITTQICRESREASSGAKQNHVKLRTFGMKEGSLRRYPTFLPQRRISDIHTLMKSSSPSDANGMRLALSIMEPTIRQCEFQMALLRRLKDTSPLCPLEKPAEWYELVMSCADHADWRSSQGVAESEYMGIALRSSAPGKVRLDGRLDCVILGGEFLLLDLYGYLDGLLQASLVTAGERLSSAYQERITASEVRKIFKGVRHISVETNVSWIEGTPAGPLDQDHDGEIDVLAEGGQTRWSYQAKAALSEDFSRRCQLTWRDAAEQHKRLDRGLQHGITLLKRRDGRNGHRFQSWKTAIADRTLIPFTVTFEEAGSWGVGGHSAGSGEPPIVRTTVDHLRIVNELLPPPLAISYWFSRWLIEQGTIAFVNEVCFLDYWITRVFATADDQIELIVVDTPDLPKPALWPDEAVEPWVTWNSMYFHISTGPQWWRDADAKHRRSVVPMSRYPQVIRLLNAIAEHAAGDWLIALQLLCVNVSFDYLETRLRDGQDVTFRTKDFALAVVHGSARSEGYAGAGPREVIVFIDRGGSATVTRSRSGWDTTALSGTVLS